ncbi:hypothetical protein CALVIDRAFT_497638 [Calocera viscosa TUFC12733]|uniref:Zn(2)-C6 fungal-type domain-containing protein n=1 Tax=Calocera viscosa (strain TUFC12733) TaxID=1330018 RepID=A0A167N4Y0_CALVF|nr:hypothetical protein CALVIDRAFT_497638 [Calocera viscosa TUFC12733]
MANRAHIPHSQRANRHQPRQGQQQQQGQHSFSPPTDSPSAVTYHHSSSTTSPQATSYDFPLPGPPHPLPHHAAGSSSSASQLSPTSLSSASSPYDTNPMIGSVPPQPSPYAPGYLTDLSHQNALANAAFDGLAQRQEYIHAASTATYPNLHGLDTRNLGGNIHPSALYSSFSFDSSGLPPYPLQQQNGYPPHGQGFPTGEQEMYFPPAPPQQNGFPQVDVDVGPSPPTHFPQQQQAYHPSLAPAQGYPSISPSSWGESEGYFSSSQQQFRPQPTAVQHAHAHGHGHGQQSGSSNELSSLGSGSADSLPQLLHGHAQAQGGNQFPHPAMNGNGNGNVSSSSGSGRNSNPNPKKRRLEDGRPHALPPPVRGDVKLEGEEEEEEEESDVDAPGGGGQQAQGKEQKKTAQACSHCKRLKMKCEREPGQAKCNRCLHRNQECEYLGRKPRVKSKYVSRCAVLLR